jgi:hypothetical protein
MRELPDVTDRTRATGTSPCPGSVPDIEEEKAASHAGAIDTRQGSFDLSRVQRASAA